MRLAPFAVIALTSLAGCGGAEVLSLSCVNDAECDDGLFCNGVETCQAMGGRTTACVRTVRDCSAFNGLCGPGVCNETDNVCELVQVDADSDGHVSSGCGGTDCDDNDPARYPGATEVCNQKDEDCNDATYGVDADTDGFESAACCNGPGNCGLDCDDTRVSVHPDGSEICNGLDDNCDGTIDEGMTLPLYLDFDRDGYGVFGGTPISLCSVAAGYSTLNNDCDDKNAAITPGTLVCNTGTAAPGDIRICTSAGTWFDSTCAGQGACVVQPNGPGGAAGTGVCL